MYKCYVQKANAIYADSLTIRKSTGQLRAFICGIEQISLTIAGVALHRLFGRYVHQLDIIEPNHF